MPLTLTDLSLLIELVENELDTLHAVLDDEDAPETIVDDTSDIVVQVDNTAGNLREQYESLWDAGCNYPAYPEFLKGIRESKTCSEK